MIWNGDPQGSPFPFGVGNKEAIPGRCPYPMDIPAMPPIHRKSFLCDRYSTRYPNRDRCGPFTRSIPRMLTMFKVDDLILAHTHSSDHRRLLQEDGQCGISTCLNIFPPGSIERWIPDTRDDTAICPHCTNDSVLGNSCGHEITTEFLKTLRRFWRPSMEDRASREGPCGRYRGTYFHAQASFHGEGTSRERHVHDRQSKDDHNGLKTRGLP